MYMIRTGALRKWRNWGLWKSYFPPTLTCVDFFFFNLGVRLLSDKVLSEKVFNFLLNEKWPKMSILRFFHSYSLIYYVRKVFQQILHTPTILKYRYKISCKNIETGRRRIIFCGKRQAEFFIIFLLSGSLTMT